MLYLQDHFSLLTCYVNMATNRDSKKTDLDDKFEDFSNPWTFSYLFMSGEIKLVKWIMGHHILADNIKCVTCAADCRLGLGGKRIDGATGDS